MCVEGAGILFWQQIPKILFERLERKNSKMTEVSGYILTDYFNLTNNSLFFVLGFFF